MEGKDKNKNWKLILGVSLVILSALFYFTHYLIFRDSHHIFIYLLGDIAFIPLEIFFVSLILDSLLESRDKKKRLKKTHVMIGMFFNIVGYDLLEELFVLDTNKEQTILDLRISANWDENKYREAIDKLKSVEDHLLFNKENFKRFKTNLVSKKEQIVTFLDKDGIFEKDEYCNLVWSIFHLLDEVSLRKTLKYENDIAHISNDALRVYIPLIILWLNYMIYLKKDYPFLYSLAVRNNPFSEEDNVEIK